MTRAALAETCLVPRADGKKRVVSKYLKDHGFYSYDAAEPEDDPLKRWIGREVKRFLSEGHKHLPFLLRLAAAPPEVVNENDEQDEEREGVD